MLSGYGSHLQGIVGLAPSEEERSLVLQMKKCGLIDDALIAFDYDELKNTSIVQFGTKSAINYSKRTG